MIVDLEISADMKSRGLVLLEDGRGMEDSSSMHLVYFRPSTTSGLAVTSTNIRQDVSGGGGVTDGTAAFFGRPRGVSVVGK